MGNERVIELQLHYVFKDADLHSMNATVFNECEKHFIQAIEHLSKYRDFIIEVEVLAREDGSLKSKYKILASDPIVLVLLTAFAMTFFQGKIPQAINPTEEIKNRLEIIQGMKELHNNGELTDAIFDYITKDDKGLKKIKSEFYKSAKREERIERIEIVDNKPINNTPIFEKQEIHYTEFDNCILKEDFERKDVQVDVSAKIYIAVPILVKGMGDSWRGIYNGKDIRFKITDKEFLERVYAHIIKFSNGTYINCKMQIIKTIDSYGKEISFYYDVFYVINFGDDDNLIMPIAHKRKLENNNSSEQLSLFDN